jgi:hypothetical protein
LRVLYAVICEEASARADGRVDMHGVFHQLYAPGFPAQQDQMVLATAIEWNEGELGRQAFRIDLLDPNDTPVLTISGHTDVGPSAGGDAPPQTRLVMPLENVVFPTAGTYVFHLYVGEASTSTALAPLHVIENPDAV